MNFKKIIAGTMAFFLVLGSVSLPEQSVFDKVIPDTAVTADAASSLKYEAENATLSSDACILNSKVSGVSFSGGKYVDTRQGDVTFYVNVSSSAYYNINFYSYGVNGKKENDCVVDGNKVGSFSTKEKQYGKSAVSNVYLKAGKHTIKMQKNWGWIYLDYIELQKAAGVNENTYDVSLSLSNKNANETTKKLYAYLCDSYGNKVITGQQCDGGINGSEFKKIKNLTGKTPAILGLDFMDYSPSRVALGASGRSVDKAVEFANKGGIVTFCWHWNAPTNYLKSTANSSDGWWGGFYTKNVDTSKMNLEKMLSGEDKYGYNFLVNEIDAIAKQMKILQDKDITVLFRPLHEASGGWFWWGAYGSETYKKLWKFMYNRLTNVHKLNNIIWVFNGQSGSWYPGDNYVDIIGEDIYPGKKVYNPQSSKFIEATKYSKTVKPIVMSENGCLFDIDKAFDADTKWLWFCTWGGEFANTSNYTEDYMWKKVYNNSKAVTLENLPNLKTYPINGANSGDIKNAKVSIKSSSYTYTGKDIKPNVTVKFNSKTLVKGKDYTVSYTNIKAVGKACITIKGIGKFSGSVKKYFSIVPAAPTVKFAAASGNAVKISWNKCSGADIYDIYQYKNNKWIKVKTTSSLSFTCRKLKSGTTYLFKVKAYKKSVGNKYSKTSSTVKTCTKPSKPIITSLNSTTSKTVKTVWKKVYGASGYQLHITSSKSLKGGIYSNTSSNSKTITKLVKGRKYYVRVRTYKTINGVKHYGSWSSVKSVKSK